MKFTLLWWVWKLSEIYYAMKTNLNILYYEMKFTILWKLSEIYYTTKTKWNFLYCESEIYYTQKSKGNLQSFEH